MALESNDKCAAYLALTSMATETSILHQIDKVLRANAPDCAGVYLAFSEEEKEEKVGVAGDSCKARAGGVQGLQFTCIWKAPASLSGNHGLDRTKAKAMICEMVEAVLTFCNCGLGDLDGMYGSVQTTGNGMRTGIGEVHAEYDKYRQIQKLEEGVSFELTSVVSKLTKACISSQSLAGLHIVLDLLENKRLRVLVPENTLERVVISSKCTLGIAIAIHNNFSDDIQRRAAKANSSLFGREHLKHLDGSSEGDLHARSVNDEMTKGKAARSKWRVARAQWAEGTEPGGVSWDDWLAQQVVAERQQRDPGRLQRRVEQQQRQLEQQQQQHVWQRAQDTFNNTIMVEMYDEIENGEEMGDG
ncbi:hypothetical protein TeGR_g15311 [Tetraparma gracilis]|uniref:Uncharacterized protein n=1 Tax=Tetraparma gracilis TaxID=2962635 RepID=A0ABQ6MQ23_9STRA|nr:hypothetical protein TeGR_g15311 [Tetraparma gracilis]